MGVMFEIERAALISPCGLYRYTLTRTWDGTLPVLVFIMLNPSTANGAIDDATIRVCVGRAMRMGYGGILVVNLFAYRATQPSDMFAAAKAGTDIVGPDNDEHIAEAAELAVKTQGKIILAYGADGAFQARDKAVLKILRDEPVYCLGTTLLGEPRHPLRIAYSVAPRPWTSNHG